MLHVLAIEEERPPRLVAAADGDVEMRVRRGSRRFARAQERERPVPRFVERELRAFLHCGVLAHGFIRVHCCSASAMRST